MPPWAGGVLAMADPFAFDFFEDSGRASLTRNVYWKSQTEDLIRYLTETLLKSFQEVIAWSCAGPWGKSWWRSLWGRSGRRASCQKILVGRSCRAPYQEILAQRCSRAIGYRDLCTKIFVEISTEILLNSIKGSLHDLQQVMVEPVNAKCHIMFPKWLCHFMQRAKKDSCTRQGFLKPALLESEPPFFHFFSCFFWCFFRGHCYRD